MSVTLPSEDPEWRENWKARIRAQARIQVPGWLQSSGVTRTRLKPLASVASIPQARPGPAETIRVERGTEPIELRTAILPITRLLPQPMIRDTRELVSAAIRWFYERHGCVPSVVGLNPLRCLAICESREFYPVDCEDLGVYTIEIWQESLPCDTIRLRYEVGGIEDFYL